ncbi:MAG: tryptophan-rich sensory protein [Patescibacteria group bacterium]|nr:tryptophan-rich sensory protein [Patescibacteria group bacterium]
MKNKLKLIVAIAICELAGVIGSIFTISTIPTWYATLAKPALNPPTWVFGPVWTILYLFMGIAAFLIWNRNSNWKIEHADTRKALWVFLLQLILNTAWSIIFFGLHSPLWAFVDLVAMWLVILWTMTLFYKISKPAMWLLLPYILWVSFAGYLNYSIVILNQENVAVSTSSLQTPTQTSQNSFDGKNATFTIDGKPVTLVNGISKVPAAPDSASQVTTRYFGNEATGDLTGDGLPDTAFLITQDTGGSGLFYYAVVAIQTAHGYKTTNAVFLGDRIAPQSTSIVTKLQELEINYAERKPGEPMTAQPSVGTTTVLKVTSIGVLEAL